MQKLFSILCSIFFAMLLFVFSSLILAKPHPPQPSPSTKTTQGSMNVTTNVIASCNMTAGPALDFGDVVAGTGIAEKSSYVTLNCSRGTIISSLTVDTDTLGAKELKDGDSIIVMQVYKTAGVNFNNKKTQAGTKDNSGNWIGGANVGFLTNGNIVLRKTNMQVNIYAYIDTATAFANTTSSNVHTGTLGVIANF